jgi:hypothetical protein
VYYDHLTVKRLGAGERYFIKHHLLRTEGAIQNVSVDIGESHCGITRKLFTKCGIVFRKLRHDDRLSVTLYTLARHDIELHQIDGTVS